MTSNGQLGLLPEGCDEGLAALCAPKLGACVGAEFSEVPWTEVGQLMMLPVRPEILDRVQLRRIWRQELQLDATALACDVVAHQPAAVRLQAIPDDQQLSPVQVPSQCLQEGDDLGRANRSRHQLEIDVPEADTGHCRQLLPGEAVLQHRRLTQRGPGAQTMGTFREAGLIYEDDDPAQFF